MEVVRIGQNLGIFWVKQIELGDGFDNAVNRESKVTPRFLTFIEIGEN